MYRQQQTHTNVAHQQAQVRSDEAYEAACLEQLRERYLARTPLPNTQGTALTLEQLYRFYRYIRAEGYGR